MYAITKADHDRMTRNMDRPLTWQHARWVGRDKPTRESRAEQTSQSREVVR